jgi:hypothetical protein
MPLVASIINAAFGMDFVDRHDVFVPQGAAQLSFLAKLLRVLFVVRKVLAENFDGHDLASFGIDCPIDSRKSAS